MEREQEEKVEKEEEGGKRTPNPIFTIPIKKKGMGDNGEKKRDVKDDGSRKEEKVLKTKEGRIKSKGKGAQRTGERNTHHLHPRHPHCYHNRHHHRTNC